MVSFIHQLALWIIAVWEIKSSSNRILSDRLFRLDFVGNARLSIPLHHQPLPVLSAAQPPISNRNTILSICRNQRGFAHGREPAGISMACLNGLLGPHDQKWASLIGP